jgi:uncharacterized membrane protein
MEKSFFTDDSDKRESDSIPDLNDNNQDHSSSGEESFATDEGRLAAIMAYIPFLCFVPLLKMRSNREAQFHARQGVVLFLIELAAVLFLIDTIADFVFKAVLILAFGSAVAGIVFALQGKNYRLPVVSDLADRFKL